ncbi:MAG TPA: alpha/beta hydrolase [Kofleriaceae bacterium]|jgi:pimeloyl-ACP methyl ester carboxylesterase
MRTILALAFLTACSHAPAPDTTPPKTPVLTHYTAFTVKVTGAGRPVIFIPGLGSSGDVWNGTVAHLGGKVQAHVLTLAGFAGVPPIAPPFLQTVHDQIIDYIRGNNLDHPIIVGHSLGGAMSLWLAETDPELGGVIDVDGMPFIAAAQDPNATAAQGAAIGKQVGAPLETMPHDQFVTTSRTFVASMVTKPADVDTVTAWSAASDQKTFATAFAELFGLDLRPDLPKIKVPVTIIAAAMQGNLPREKLEAVWHAQIDANPQIHIAFVENARHFVMLDQPDAFYALIDQLLAH